MSPARPRPTLGEGAGEGSGPQRRARLLAGAAFFAAVVAVLTVLGLLLTRGQARRWRVVVTADRELPSAASRLSIRRLRAWDGARGGPPREVAEFDGAAVEMVGIARPEPAAGGLWLVSDSLAVDRRRPVPRDGAVWIALSGTAGVEGLVEAGRVIRARGVLRVGRTEVTGLGEAAYRLELETLWVREGDAGHHEHGHED